MGECLIILNVRPHGETGPYTKTISFLPASIIVCLYASAALLSSVARKLVPSGRRQLPFSETDRCHRVYLLPATMTGEYPYFTAMSLTEGKRCSSLLDSRSMESILSPRRPPTSGPPVLRRQSNKLLLSFLAYYCQCP